MYSFSYVETRSISRAFTASLTNDYSIDIYMITISLCAELDLDPGLCSMPLLRCLLLDSEPSRRRIVDYISQLSLHEQQKYVPLLINQHKVLEESGTQLIQSPMD